MENVNCDFVNLIGSDRPTSILYLKQGFLTGGNFPHGEILGIQGGNESV